MKKYYWNAIGVFIGLTVATLGADKIGYPLLFYFLGGLIMSASAFLFLIPAERRNRANLIVMPILSATAFTLVYFFANKLFSI